MLNKTKINAGFSLTELLMVLTIMSLLSAGVLKSMTILGKSFAETRNLTLTQMEIERFVQNTKILVYSAFEGEFRTGGNNTGTTYTALENTPSPVNDSLYLSMVKKPNASRYVNWSKMVFQNNRLYWVNSIASLNTTVTKPETEKWQLLLDNVYRSDDVSGTNPSSATDPIFRFIYTNPRNCTGIAGVYIRCRIRLRPTSMDQKTKTILFETSIRFANV